MKPATLLLLGAVAIGAVVLVSQSAGAEPTGPGGKPVPPNLRLIRSEMGLLGAAGLVKDAQEGDPLVVAVWSPATEQQMIGALIEAAAANPSILFAAAPVDLVLKNIPDEYADQVPDDPRWGVAGIRDADVAYQNVSSSDDMAGDIPRSVGLAVMAASGMPAEQSSQFAEPLSLWIWAQLQSDQPPAPPVPPVPPDRVPPDSLPPLPGPQTPPNDGGPVVLDPKTPTPIPNPTPTPEPSSREVRHAFEGWAWVISIKKSGAQWDWWARPPTSNMAVIGGKASSSAQAEKDAIAAIPKWDRPLEYNRKFGEYDLVFSVRRSTQTIWAWFVETADGKAIARGEANSQDKARTDAAAAAYRWTNSRPEQIRMGQLTFDLYLWNDGRYWRWKLTAPGQEAALVSGLEKTRVEAREEALRAAYRYEQDH